MVFRALFYLKYISNQDDLLQAKLLLECYQKKENLTFQNNKEVRNGPAKMQKYVVAGCIKGFLIISSPKTKKN